MNGVPAARLLFSLLFALSAEPPAIEYTSLKFCQKFKAYIKVSGNSG
jgi:hypothetical protein